MRGGVDGAWPPRGGQALPRSGAQRGASAGRRAEAGWADFDHGLEVRRRPAKEKKSFSKYIFKEFLHAIFQILF